MSVPWTSHNYRFVFGHPFLYPIVDVYLLGPHGKVQLEALVDTGAVRPIFPQKAAADAGIKLSATANDWIQYGSGVTLARRRSVSIGLGDHMWQTDVSFVERLDLPYALLGRVGVFSEFGVVKFIERTDRPRVEFWR